MAPNNARARRAQMESVAWHFGTMLQRIHKAVPPLPFDRTTESSTQVKWRTEEKSRRMSLRGSTSLLETPRNSL